MANQTTLRAAIEAIRDAHIAQADEWLHTATMVGDGAAVKKLQDDAKAEMLMAKLLTAALAKPDAQPSLTREEWRDLVELAEQAAAGAQLQAALWAGRGREAGYLKEAEEARRLAAKCRAHAEETGR